MADKSIRKEINQIINVLKDSDEAPSDEVLELIDDIQEEISKQETNKKENFNDELISKIKSLVKSSLESKLVSIQSATSIISALKELKIETPIVNVPTPQVKVTVPEVKIPPINVKVPHITVPKTEIKYPDSMGINKPSWLYEIFSPIVKKLDEIKNKLVFQTFKLPTRARDAIPVRLSDGEKFYRAMGGMVSAIAGGFSFRNSKNETRQALIDEDDHIQTDILTSALPTGAATSSNQTSGDQQTKIKETAPTDVTKVNSSSVLAYDVDDQLITITKTIGVTSYTKTLTWTDGVLTDIGVWIEV